MNASFQGLNQNVNSHQLIYFDNSATTQKPRKVLKCLDEIYTRYAANVHRGTHHLSLKATELYETARRTIAEFVCAHQPEEIVFTKGATEAINLVANTWGLVNIDDGDEIVTTIAEHHSNLVPWQMLSKKKNGVLKVVPLPSDVTKFPIDGLLSRISMKTKLIALSYISNVIGSINPVKEIIKKIRDIAGRNVMILVDACQAPCHVNINVTDLDCDFLVASGHKMLGPTSIGFLYGKYNVLDAMPPWQGGGEMIKTVTAHDHTFADVPLRFEAGTPPIAEAIALAEAAKYILEARGLNIYEHEHSLAEHLKNELTGLSNVHVYSGADIPLVAFNHEKIHPSDLSVFLNQEGIAVRSGHHCTQPLHNTVFKTDGSVRASLSFYNTHDEIDRFSKALKRSILYLERFS